MTLMALKAAADVNQEATNLNLVVKAITDVKKSVKATTDVKKMPQNKLTTLQFFLLSVWEN